MREQNILQLCSLTPNAPLSGSIFAQEPYRLLANAGIMTRCADSTNEYWKLLNPLNRNAKGHFNQNPYSVHSQYTLPLMGFKPKFPLMILVMVFVQSALWPLRRQR